MGLLGCEKGREEEASPGHAAALKMSLTACWTHRRASCLHGTTKTGDCSLLVLATLLLAICCLPSRRRYASR
jgi:hypothetical protein